MAKKDLDALPTGDASKGQAAQQTVEATERATVAQQVKDFNLNDFTPKKAHVVVDLDAVDPPTVLSTRPGATEENLDRIVWLEKNCMDPKKTNWVVRIKRVRPTSQDDIQLDTLGYILEIPITRWKDIYDEVKKQLGGGEYKVVVQSDVGEDEQVIGLKIDVNSHPVNLDNMANRKKGFRGGTSAAAALQGQVHPEDKDALRLERELEKKKREAEMEELDRRQQQKRRQWQREDAKERQEEERRQVQPEIESVRSEMREMKNEFTNVLRSIVDKVNTKPEGPNMAEILLTMEKEKAAAEVEKAKAEAERFKHEKELEMKRIEAEKEERRREAEAERQARKEELEMKAKNDLELEKIKSESQRKAEEAQAQLNAAMMDSMKAELKSSNQKFDALWSTMLEKKMESPFQQFAEYEEFKARLIPPVNEEEGGMGQIGNVLAAAASKFLETSSARQQNPGALPGPPAQAAGQTSNPPQSFPQNYPKTPGASLEVEVDDESSQPAGQLPGPQQGQQTQMTPQQQNELMRLRGAVTDCMKQACEDMEAGVLNHRWIGEAVGEIGAGFLNMMYQKTNDSEGPNGRPARLRMIQAVCEEHTFRQLTNLLSDPDKYKSAYEPFWNSWEIALGMHKDRMGS